MLPQSTLATEGFVAKVAHIDIIHVGRRVQMLLQGTISAKRPVAFLAPKCMGRRVEMMLEGMLSEAILVAILTDVPVSWRIEVLQEVNPIRERFIAMTTWVVSVS